MPELEKKKTGVHFISILIQTVTFLNFRENSEQESVSSDSGGETSRDARSGDQEAVSEEQEDMETDGR